MNASVLTELKQKIEFIGYSFEVTESKVIITSEHFKAIINNQDYEVIPKITENMNQLHWEDFTGEVDNINRAIHWIILDREYIFN